ncbi:peptidase domain-containing ABC transporter [Duganella sp. CY15W]|uniref:peptidase domain-containing ABC transporter n=1 Tax=Duganella sp. CY15W TaxID=2692172 RepID=UPI001E488687|nr:peptidase domain-containing ABC transporter [Duganella sp. CY15W]
MALDLSKLNLSFRKRLPVVLQSESAECGLACLAMVLGYHGHMIDLSVLRSTYSGGARGLSMKHLVDIAEHLKLDTRAVKVTLDDLAYLKKPALLHWNLDHFVVLKSVSATADGRLLSACVHDPAHGELRLDRAAISAAFTGIALELAPGLAFTPKVERRRMALADLLRGVGGLGKSLLTVFGLAVSLELFALTAPLLMQLVVDGVVPASDRELLAVACLGFACLAALQVGVGALRSWTILYISSQLNLQMTSGIFRHLLHLPLSYFERRHLGDVASRFAAIHEIQDKLSTRFIEAVIDGVLAATSLLVLCYYRPLLAAVVLAFFLVYLLFRWTTQSVLREAGARHLVLQGREQSLFLESVRGIQTIKLFNHERGRLARWQGAAVDVANQNIRLSKLGLYFSSASALLAAVENILVIWLAALAILDSRFTLGMLYAFIAYKMIFTARAYALVDKLLEFRMLGLQTERLSDIVLAQREEHDGVAAAGQLAPLVASAAPNVIELRNVSFRYSEAEPWVLYRVSLVVRRGESLAITGRSGCGKTTLLKLLTGILPPSSGDILVFGKPLATLGAREYRRYIATVMQEDQLFAGSIEENIAFFDSTPDRERVRECARFAAIEEDIEAMVMGYQSLIGDMASGLSGGQKQRLLLARALYKQPELILLDEATSHLDSENERLVNHAISQLQMTKIIIAHRRETIASAGRVVELADGGIVRDFRQNYEAERLA